MTEGKSPKGAITVAVEGGSLRHPARRRHRHRRGKGPPFQGVGEAREGSGRAFAGRLYNPKFVESAPEDIVEETREKLALGEDEAAKLNAALKRLADIG